MKLTRKAHAKLNLFLEVTGKRENGYHELYSLVVFLDLADEITIEAAPAITVIEAGSNLNIADNIISKTANLLAQKYEVKTGAQISFTKNIPIGAGLGGGSSDAAVTLVLLNALWDLRLSDDELYGLALELGADVPVCLYSILENKNAAIFKGIGELIGPAPKIPKMFFTLANPGIELATEKVFKAFHYEGLGYEPLKRHGDFLKNISQRCNDLEPAAIRLVPEIAVALDELATTKNCQLARMTGSGATSFGIFKNRKSARDAAIDLIKKHPDWQIGPVGLKKISNYTWREKLKRPFLKPQLRILKSARSVNNSRLFNLLAAPLVKLHIKPTEARILTYVVLLHFIAFFFYDASFTPLESTPTPGFVTVAFAVENTPEPEPEAKYEPAAGEIAESPAEEVEPTAPAEKEPPKPPVKKKPPAHKTAAKKPGTAAAKKSTTTSGSAYAKSEVAPVVASKDYLELLQYTVRDLSHVPPEAPNLKGSAVIHLEFTRLGYVVAYSLKEKSGIQVLDDAAINVAKKLKTQPFPQVPDDFDKGEAVLKYDFLITYPPEPKAKI